MADDPRPCAVYGCSNDGSFLCSDGEARCARHTSQWANIGAGNEESELIAENERLRGDLDKAEAEVERLRDILDRVRRAIEGVGSWPDTIAAEKIDALVVEGLTRAPIDTEWADDD